MNCHHIILSCSKITKKNKLSDCHDTVTMPVKLYANWFALFLRYFSWLLLYSGCHRWTWHHLVSLVCLRPYVYMWRKWNDWIVDGRILFKLDLGALKVWNCNSFSSKTYNCCYQNHSELLSPIQWRNPQ